LCHTENDIFQIHVNPDECILTAFFSGPWSTLGPTLTKEGLENVPKRSKTAETGLAPRVVLGALLGVGEDIVRV
jgi:hypothetical protein